MTSLENNIDLNINQCLSGLADFYITSPSLFTPTTPPLLEVCDLDRFDDRLHFRLHTVICDCIG